jgi:hypothetical protein
VTTTLSDAIQAAKIREWDVHEQKLAAELKLHVPAPVLTADVLARVDIWAKWCASKRVRKCPGRPASVAAFLLEQNALGVSAQVEVSLLEAIEAIHNHHNLSNPCATPVVNAALDQIVKSVPPRWDKDERAEWARLPPLVREAISRREKERDAAVRRSQNAAAEVRKKRHNGADESVKYKEVENETHTQ